MDLEEGPPPLFLGQSEAWRAEKIFLEATPPSPFPPLIWRSRSAIALNDLVSRVGSRNTGYFLLITHQRELILKKKKMKGSQQKEK